MFSKQEAQALRQQFWTALGQYMKPVPSHCLEQPHWVNYKTGIHHVSFHMQTFEREAYIAVEFAQADAGIRNACLEQFQAQEAYFTRHMGESWTIKMQAGEISSRPMTAIVKTQTGLNVLRREDWPALISFFKPRILLLDEWWSVAKDGFEQAIIHHQFSS